MAQIRTLKDKDGKTLYPITSSQAVFDANGVNLDTRLNNKVEKVQGKVLSSNDYTNDDKQKLDSLPTGAALTESLGDKQGLLQNSEEITINDGQLSLTERAKREVFIDLFNTAAGDYGKYDPDNAPDLEHPFYLNKLWLSWEQAIYTYVYGRDFCSNIPSSKITTKIVTNMLTQWSNAQYNFLPSRSFYNWKYLKIIRISDKNDENVYTGRATNSDPIFSHCDNLEEVIGVFSTMNRSQPFGSFQHCPKLHTLRIAGIFSNWDLSSLPSLSSESIMFAINNRSSVSILITITVHPDVYAKLIGDTTNAAYNDLTDEEKTQWTALLAQAAEKNIQFATA